MKKLLLTILSVVSTSVFAAEDLVLEHEVPVVLTGGGLEYKNIVYPAGAYQNPGIGSLTLDGATVTANSVLYAESNWQNGLLALCNGATLSFASGCFFAANSYGNSHGLITLEGGSSLTFGQALTIGCGAYNANTGSAEIRAQDSTLTVNHDLAGMGKFTWKMTNCVVSSTAASGRQIKIGGVGGTYAYANAVGITNRVEFVDTDFAYGGQFQLALQLPGTMLLSGGTFTLGNSWLIAGWGTNAETIGIPELEASAELTDGAVATVNGGQVSIGAQVGTHGAMSLSGGSSLTALTVYVGQYGEGVLTVDATSSVKATTAFKIAVNAESESSVTLNGGALEVKSVIGGSGTSSFVSNGGTVRMLADSRIFDSVGTVTVGAEGLTVDTQGHAVTLNQSLTGGKVIFTGGGSVTFAEGVTVDDFDATGGTKLIWAGEAVTTVVEKTDAGTETRRADVLVAGKDKIAFNVSEGAALTMAGKVGVGSMEKLGGGLLALDNPADKFYGGLALTAGTLAFGSNAPASMTSGLKLGNAANTLTVIKADADITLAFPDAPVSGAFLKRGVGDLVLMRTAGAASYEPTAPIANSHFAIDNPLSFGDLEPVPTANFACVNVAEGRMVIRGGNPSARNSFRYQRSFAVGLPVTSCAVQPELVLDNVDLNQASSALFYLGPAAIEGVSAIVEPKLTLTNSSLSVHTLQIAGKSTNPNLRPRVAMDGSTLTCSFALMPNGGYQSGSRDVFTELTFRNNSKVYPKQVYMTFPFKAEFDNSILAYDSTRASVKLSYYDGQSVNRMEFTNGSKFYFDGVNFDLVNAGNKVSAAQEMVFDDSEWILSTAAGDKTFTVDSRVNMQFIMRGKGLVAKPAAGEIWTMSVALTGEGGFVNRGEGTVVLPGDCIKYTGVTCAESGVIDFGGASVTNVTLAGAGMFAHGTLTDAKVLADGTAPQIDGVTVDGKVTVVFGETAPEIGTTVDVARYTGSIANWKVKRSKDYSVTLTTDGTTVRATIEPPKGLMLLFR